MIRHATNPSQRKKPNACVLHIQTHLCTKTLRLDSKPINPPERPHSSIHPVFFLSFSMLLSAHPSLHPHQLHSRNDIISYVAPPTLPQGGETTRQTEREQESARERERALGWVGLTIDRKRKRDTENDENKRRNDNETQA